MVKVVPSLGSVPATSLDEWLQKPKLPAAILKSESVYKLKRFVDRYGFKLSRAVYSKPVLVYNDANLWEIEIPLGLSQIEVCPDCEIDTPVAKIKLDTRLNVTQVEFHDSSTEEKVQNCNKQPFLSGERAEFRTQPIEYATIMQLPMPENLEFVLIIQREKYVYTLGSLQYVVNLIKHEAREFDVEIVWEQMPGYKLLDRKIVSQVTEHHAKVSYYAELYSNGIDTLLVGTIDVQLRGQQVEYVVTSCMGNGDEYVVDDFLPMPLKFVVACNESAIELFEDSQMSRKLDTMWRYLPATVFVTRSHVTEPVSCASTASAAKVLSKQAEKFSEPEPFKQMPENVKCVIMLEDRTESVQTKSTMFFVPEYSDARHKQLRELKLLHTKEIDIGVLASKLKLDSQVILNEMLQNMYNLELYFSVRACELVLAHLVCGAATDALSAHPEAQITGFLPFRVKDKTGSYKRFVMVSYTLDEKEYASVYRVVYFSGRAQTHEPHLQDGSTKQAWKLHHVITGELLQREDLLLVANKQGTCLLRFDKSDEQLYLVLNDLVTIDDIKAMDQC